MLDNSKGKIFLASERGHTETDWFRSYQTFSFGSYQQEHKGPFGSLHTLNDDTLAAQKTVTYVVESNTILVLLPVVGTLDFVDNMRKKVILEAGQIQVLYYPREAVIEISNPFSSELINYLQLWIKCPDKAISTQAIFSFNLEENKDQLINLLNYGRLDIPPLPGLRIQIGKFKGREEVVYPLSRNSLGVFAFVLQGAFEVQNRLLEARDGLALWETDQIELEALSNEAIILLVEVPGVESGIGMTGQRGI